MAKEFYTERDIEDLWKRGTQSLQLSEAVVLTDLAFEKAERLGMKLLRATPDAPPAAPVRPYLSQGIAPAAPAALPVPDLAERIREAVQARLGSQVDPALLDAIITRVLKTTGIG